MQRRVALMRNQTQNDALDHDRSDSQDLALHAVHDQPHHGGTMVDGPPVVKTRNMRKRVALTQNQAQNVAQDHNQNEAQDRSLHAVQDQSHYDDYLLNVSTMVKPGKKLRHVALTQNQTESDAQYHKHNEAQVSTMVKTRKKQRRVALTQNQTENEAQDHNHGEAQDMSLLNMQDQPHHESDTHSTVISPPSIHYSAVQEGHEGSVIDVSPMKTRKKQRQVVLTQNVTENDARDYNQNEAEDLLLHTVQDHPCVPYPGIQEDPGHDHSVFDASNGKQRTRGRTQMTNVWNLPQDERILLRFNNKSQPYGREARVLSSFIGVLVRNGQRLPLNYKTWRKVPAVYKKDIIELLKTKFFFPLGHTGWILKALGKKWKDFKSELKAEYFYRYKTKGELLENKPPEVQKDQWEFLVGFWLSEEGKRISETNKRNRAKLDMLHTTGSKSFATFSSEKTTNGVEPNRMELFMMTRKHKDGSFVDEHAAEVAEKFEALMSRCNNRSKTSQDTISCEDNTWEDEICLKVFGKERPGRVRGLGFGPTPSEMWGLSSRRFQSMSVCLESGKDEEIIRLREELRTTQETVAQLEKEASKHISLSARVALLEAQVAELSRHGQFGSAMQREIPNEHMIAGSRPGEASNVSSVSRDSQPGSLQSHQTHAIEGIMHRRYKRRSRVAA